MFTSNVSFHSQNRSLGSLAKRPLPQFGNQSQEPQERIDYSPLKQKNPKNQPSILTISLSGLAVLTTLILSNIALFSQEKSNTDTLRKEALEHVLNELKKPNEALAFDTESQSFSLGESKFPLKELTHSIRYSLIEQKGEGFFNIQNVDKSTVSFDCIKPSNCVQANIMADFFEQFPAVNRLSLDKTSGIVMLDTEFVMGRGTITKQARPQYKITEANFNMHVSWKAFLATHSQLQELLKNNPEAELNEIYALTQS